MLSCVSFSLSNQTIIDICPLARSHEEEHPNREEKSQSGKWAGWERKARYFVSSPHGSKDLKFTVGEVGGRGGGITKEQQWIQNGHAPSQRGFASYCLVSKSLK